MNTLVSDMAPREVAEKVTFRRDELLRGHAETHVFKNRHEQWWKLLGDNVVGEARAELINGQPGQKFQHAAVAYESFLSNRLIEVCQQHIYHCHFARLGLNEQWEEEVRGQRITAWPVDCRLFVVADAARRGCGEFRPFHLVTGYRRPELTKSGFVDWARGKAVDRPLTRLIAWHDDSRDANDEQRT